MVESPINQVEGNQTAKPRVVILATDVLFAHFFPPNVIAQLETVAAWSRYNLREDSPALRQAVVQADALMTTWHSPPLTVEILGEHPRVRLIAHCGGEVKKRIEADLFNYLTVTNAPEPMAAPVAEMALGLLLTLVRRIPQYDAEMRQGITRTNEEVSEGETVRGRKIGLIGYGRIGRAFARLCEPLGAELLIYDPYCPTEIVQSQAARFYTDVDEVLESCSVVVLAAGLTPETNNLLDRRRLALLPDGAYLINIARGGLIEMEALTDELRHGRLSAALDVTDPLEPLPPDHELRRLPNVILTPHIAAGGKEMRQAIGQEAVAEVVRFFRGESLRNVVTREMLRTMT